jgi:hypothetical protein
VTKGGAKLPLQLMLVSRLMTRTSGAMPSMTCRASPYGQEKLTGPVSGRWPARPAGHTPCMPEIDRSQCRLPPSGGSSCPDGRRLRAAVPGQGLAWRPRYRRWRALRHSHASVAACAAGPAVMWAILAAGWLPRPNHGHVRLGGWRWCDCCTRLRAGTRPSCFTRWPPTTPRTAGSSVIQTAGHEPLSLPARMWTV